MSKNNFKLKSESEEGTSLSALHTLLSILFFVFVLVQSVEAAYFLAGVVNNASNGEDANGRNVTVYNFSIGLSEHLNNTIGSNGGADPNNKYLVDCEDVGLSNPCQIDQIWTAEVIDIGDGWFAGPVNVTITGFGVDQFPDMTLNDKPNLSILLPINNSLLYGSAIVNATSRDTAGGVDMVIYSLGNSSGNYSKTAVIGYSELMQAGSSEFYNDSFDTTFFANGNYTLWVTANDTTGEGSRTVYHFVTINNTLPDLRINSSGIILSNPTPAEGVTITINASVYNVGDGAANFVMVALYNETIGGRSLIGNETIPTLDVNHSYNVSLTWVTVVGTTNITAEVDYAFSTSNITEKNETNNIANFTVIINIYTIYVGNLTGYFILGDSLNNTLYQWQISDLAGSNMYITDSDSNLGFTSLHPLGQNTTNATILDDFTELDAALGTTNYSDNLSSIWTISGAAKRNETFYLYGKDITNISVVNSTNTTSFLTGILWDTSDGGTEYTGIQDVAFVSPLNLSHDGQYGVYDFEIKVPSQLKRYNTSTTSTVSLFVELI